MEQEHKKLWSALERINPKAVKNQKRHYATGKLRLPTMYFIAKTIKSAAATWSDFAELMDG
ncbi:MAG: hypothetical protein FWD15_02385 [Alphaproteobacteria bacterium]|nr:hypothetical protein [Alphaproteobacteria bacterium]